VYGRDISEFSAYPHEKEVLFVPGTCVRVIEVNDGSYELRERMLLLSAAFLFCFVMFCFVLFLLFFNI